jgi:hypothetical protein
MERQMLPADKIAMGSKISRTMLSRREPVPVDMARLAGLIQRFHRAVDLQNRRDGEIITSLTRTLSKPRGADAERLVELIRTVVATNKRN